MNTPRIRHRQRLTLRDLATAIPHWYFTVPIAAFLATAIGWSI
jgi:hypothetical protein